MYSQEYKIIIDSDIKKVFEIFEDINIYKNFLEHLRIFNINKKIEISENETKYYAYIELSYLLFSLNYNCEILFNKNKYEIKVHGFDGSFKFINALWNFEKINENKTKIIYYIEFELKSKIQQKFAKKILDFNSDRIRLKLIKQLEKRLK